MLAAIVDIAGANHHASVYFSLMCWNTYTSSIVPTAYATPDAIPTLYACSSPSANNTNTGRKHQIRKQLSEIGYPVVGDHKYGEGFNEMQLCLCSFYLEFEYKGKLVKYSIKLPKFMENFIQKYLYTF